MTMNREEIFRIWAPDESPWSRWAKPVLFAHLDAAIPQIAMGEFSVNINWLPAPGEKVAVVLDLPGPEGVQVGMDLAARGYRPVPLYNAVPLPFIRRILDPVAIDPAAGAAAAVDVLPIVSALATASESLAQIVLPIDAPPVFLLDSNRHGGISRVKANDFDNRSICFTTDFPSANFLRANGIERVLLVQRSRILPLSDLAHVLRRWQDGGLRLERARMDVTEPAQPLEVARPSWYGMMFQRALAAFGFRRAGGGGFGAWVAAASAGG
jgi:hypothetical protein